MSPRALVAIALVVAAVPAGAARAHEATDGPTGRPCAFVPTGDPISDHRTGYLVAGPYAASGTVTCILRSGRTTVATASASGAPFVVLPPEPVAYDATGFDFLYVCTMFTPTGGTALYWYESVPTGHWSTVPHSCGTAVDTYTGPVDPGEPTVEDVVDALYLLIDFVIELLCCLDWLEIDENVCRVTRALSPGVPPAVTIEEEEGDVYVAGDLFWDCPPYEVEG